MIGDFSVGKTSSVARFIRQNFSEKYLTTVGVKIDTKLVNLEAEDKVVKLILWDIAGNNSLTSATISYLRGAAGYLLIVDGTRLPTWHSAINLQQMVTDQLGEKPFVVMLNKADLTEQWEVGDELVDEQTALGWDFIKTSARTGMGVEESFTLLARKLLKKKK